jgi:TatD DNase family protein
VIDSHCHVSDPRFDEDRAEVRERAREAGVSQFIDVGCWPAAADRERSVALATEWSECFSAIAVHPHDVGKMEPGSPDHVRELAREEKVVAIGETGLDYYYDHSPRDLQQQWFRNFLRLAGELDMPVVVHSRGADEDTARILREEGAASLRGVVHCFTGGPGLRDAVLDLGSGWHLGFTGIVTFKAADNVREAALATPIERMLVETDAPYLAPVPQRGKRNEPSFVAHTVAALAELKGVSAEELASATAGNTRRLFGLPVP